MCQMPLVPLTMGKNTVNQKAWSNIDQTSVMIGKTVLWRCHTQVNHIILLNSLYNKMVSYLLEPPQV